MTCNHVVVRNIVWLPKMLASSSSYIEPQPKGRNPTMLCASTCRTRNIMVLELTVPLHTLPHSYPGTAWLGGMTMRAVYGGGALARLALSV